MISFGAIILTGVGLAIFTGLFLKKNKALSWILFTLYTLYALVVLVQLYKQWAHFESIPVAISLFGSDQIMIGMKNSLLGWLFAFFTFGLSFLNGIFSFGFRKSEHSKNIVPQWLLILSAAVLIFFAKDLLAFFIGWEFMGWTAFFIISQSSKAKYKDGIIYFALNALGAYALMLAIWMTVSLTHTLDISASVNLLISGAASATPKVAGILGLMILAFVIKSAMYPFHVWAPRAHSSAPSDFSPFISGIMIKFGVFALVSMILPVLIGAFSEHTVNGVPVFSYVLSWGGILTSAVATVMAFSENDMKRLMAYSSVANVGYILTAIFLASPLGIQGGLLHAFFHMIFKVMIFMSMAAVVYRIGETNMSRLGGLAYKMPVTFFTFLIGIIAAAGIFPMNGFASKWIIFQAILQKKFYFMAVAMFFASTGAFLYLYRALHSIFLGQVSTENQLKVKEVPFLMQIPMWIGMILIFVLGVFPGLLLKPMQPLVAALGLPNSFFPETLHEIIGSVGSMDTMLGLVIFIVGVLIAAVIFFVSAKHKNVEMMDNYTAGEDPKDWGVTPERYQFDYGFYQPIEEVFMPLMKVSVDGFWRKFGLYTKLLGQKFIRIFNDDNNWGYIAVMGIIVITLLGGIIS